MRDFDTLTRRPHRLLNEDVNVEREAGAHDTLRDCVACNSSEGRIRRTHGRVVGSQICLM